MILGQAPTYSPDGSGVALGLAQYVEDFFLRALIRED
jgi:hypothetical protein